MELITRHGMVTLDLARGEIVSLDDAEGVRIKVRDGLLWVTQERSDADHVIEPGGHLVVTRAGRTLVEALGAGRVELSSASPQRGR